MITDLLSPEHRQALERDSGISAEAIAVRGYKTVTTAKELAALNFTPAQRQVPGLLIPIWAPDGTAASYQLRPDSPRRRRKGKDIKYETPKGSSIRVDCPPLCRPQVGDPSVPIWITEGVKKGDSLASRGCCVLDLIGVWGFRGRNASGGITTSADLDGVAWNDRLAWVVFDSDVMTKPQVHDALKRLTEILRRRGARVRHVYLPPGPNGEKVGVDDYLAAGHTIEELEALAEGAKTTPGVVARRVREELPDAPATAEARVPEPYRLKAEGVYRIVAKHDRETGEEHETEMLVAPAPVIITLRSQDIESLEHDLELAWHSENSWHRVTVQRDIVADHRKLPSLALKGFPVTTLSAREITGYLATYEQANLEAIPKGMATRRCGWRQVDGKLGFVLGSHVIGIGPLPDQAGVAGRDSTDTDVLRLITDSPGTVKLVDALRAGGTYEGWQRAMASLARFPRVLIGVYASFTPALLHILGAPDFILDYCGDTSVGKTAAQHVAASAWGFPPGERGGLVVAWNSTQTFAERYAELLNDLPIFLEDSQTADPRVVARTLYMLANGVGKGRGSPRGLQGVTRWRGVAICSGERPQTEVTQQGGARARVICLWGSPFGSKDQGALVRQLKSAVSRDYGHAGPRFIKWLLDHRQEWGEFGGLYRDLCSTLAEKFPGNVGDRYATYFAALLVAGTLASQVVNLPGDPESVVQTVMEGLQEAQEESDTPLRALLDFIGWATGSHGSFEGKEDPDRRPQTYLGRWEDGQYIAVFAGQARQQLQRMGHSPETVLRSWRERGWLRADGSRYTCRMRVCGVPQHVIAIEWSALERAGRVEPASVL